MALNMSVPRRMPVPWLEVQAEPGHCPARMVIQQQQAQNITGWCIHLRCCRYQNSNMHRSRSLCCWTSRPRSLCCWMSWLAMSCWSRQLCFARMWKYWEEPHRCWLSSNLTSGLLKKTTMKTMMTFSGWRGWGTGWLLLLAWYWR